jgi:hypothetical protein
MFARRMQVRQRIPRGAIALIVAFPLLVAISLLLNTAGSTKQVLLLVALLTWFGGPVLLVIGVAMLLSRAGWAMFPATLPGRWSFSMLVAFMVSFVVFIIAISLELGPDHPETFFSNLIVAIPLLLSGALAIAAAVTGLYAMLVHKERSLVVVGVVTFGVLVAIFAVGEVAGHEEPSGPKGPPDNPTNSHSNISVFAPGPRSVQVGFDYSYGGDPPGETITAIIVTPLGEDGEALAGYKPEVRPISQGSGRLNVSFRFSDEQEAQLTGFSICFTSPEEPDLGCSITEYRPQ